MLYMFVTRHAVDGFSLHVEDLPYRRYIGYSFREAVRKYRQEFGLVGKHITII